MSDWPASSSSQASSSGGLCWRNPPQATLSIFGHNKRTIWGEFWLPIYVQLSSSPKSSEQYFRPLFVSNHPSPRAILRLIRWCSIRQVLWWPEQPSSAKSFHLTHPMCLWYMRMTYSCSDAQGSAGNAKSSKENAQSTRLGELHIWGTSPLTRSFIMAENRQGEALTPLCLCWSGQVGQFPQSPTNFRDFWTCF